MDTVKTGAGVRQRRMLLVVVLLALFAFVPSIALAAGTAPSITENVTDYKPQWINSDIPRASHLHVNGNGALERVEYIGGQLLVETLSDDMSEAVSTQTINPSTYKPSTLSGDGDLLWGGFFSGQRFNFVVTGQANLDESDAIAVFRITEYTKDWEYVSFVELMGANTAIPFDAGTCYMEEMDGRLYVRTCHQMYRTPDGLNHQANVHIVVDEQSMSVKGVNVDVGEPGTGYVSHSFAQRLACLDGTMYGLDLGDAYPRAITIKGIGNSRSAYGVLAISGRTGENYTGVTIGGFESSSARGTLLATYAAIDMGAFATDAIDDYTTQAFLPRSIYVSVSNPITGANSTVQLATCSPAVDPGLVGPTSYDYPKLVKVNEDRFLALWSKNNYLKYHNGTFQSGDVSYVFIDGSGNPEGPVRTGRALLSTCDPIVYGNRVVWYAEDVDGSHEPRFFGIDLATGELSLLAGPAMEDAEPDDGQDDDPFSHYGVDNERVREIGVNPTDDFDYEAYGTSSSGLRMVINGYHGDSKTVAIPSSIRGIPVDLVDRGAFAENGEIEELYFPDTVRDFASGYLDDGGPFAGCTSLRAINIGSFDIDEFSWDSDELFWGCTSLERLTMSDQACFNISYTGWTSEDYLNIMKAEVVDNLKYIYLGSSMRFVDERLFYGESLEWVDVGEGNPRFSSHNGVVYSADGTELLVVCPHYIGEYVVPDTCTSIRGVGFNGCTEVTRVYIPSSVTYISSGALSDCSATFVTPEGSYTAEYCVENDIPVELTKGEGPDGPSLIDVSNAAISPIDDQAFTGSAITPKPRVTIGSKTLVEETDYTLSYANNVDVGTATVTVTGIGGYTGSKVDTFLIVPAEAVAPSFSDVNDSTAHAEDIAWLAASGVSAGWDMPDGTKQFRPYANVARADMAAFLFRLARLWGLVDGSWQRSGSASFRDVNANTPHYREVMWLAEAGISQGWSVKGGKKEFRPYANVARADMAAFLFRLAGLAGMADGSWQPGGSVGFRDVNANTPHYREIMWLAEAGILQGWSVAGGKKEFRPYANVARADMAAFLHRLDGLA